MNLEVNLVKICNYKVIILSDINSSYFLSACLSSTQLTSKDPVVSVYCSAAVCLLISHYLNPVLYSVKLTRSTSCSTVGRPHNLAAAVYVKW